MKGTLTGARRHPSVGGKFIIPRLRRDEGGVLFSCHPEPLFFEGVRISSFNYPFTDFSLWIKGEREGFDPFILLD